MGFQKPSLHEAESIIRQAAGEINSPYNDGFTSSYLKLELYNLKCLLEDLYAGLPRFTDEDNWEKIRMMELLKRKEKNASD